MLLGVEARHTPLPALVLLKLVVLVMMLLMLVIMLLVDREHHCCWVTGTRGRGGVRA